MKLSFRAKILGGMFLVGTVCTSVAVWVAARRLTENGEQALIEKSRAILSRMEVGARYVAQMHTLDSIVEETIKKFPKGELPESQRLKILKSVPVYAAFQIGKEGAEKEHYKFRIASPEPRNKENQATEAENELIRKFQSDPAMKEATFKSADNREIHVSVPVKINESHNCLTCHGHPSHSPWKNGKDILGYRMENLKDGDIRATFTVISSLEPVQATVMASVREIILIGGLGTLLALFAGAIYLNRSLKRLGEISGEVADCSGQVKSASLDLSGASEKLSSASQEQASSVEEVSSSLEEISGIVESSLKGTQESVELSQKVGRLVAEGSVAMKDLQASVGEIAAANARVESLVKLMEEIGSKTEVIDEIVFQTQLLSFNASVEAERAGEHGRGFAVVAQEVGNLAQMSGKSATEISAIVKSSIKEAQEVVLANRSKVEGGVRLCQKAADQLKEIESSSALILSSAERILRASEEQNSGISQINQSIQLINQSTQENASSAEDCARGSQTLTDQGNHLEGVVQELEILVYGSKRDHQVQAPVRSKAMVGSVQPQPALSRIRRAS